MAKARSSKAVDDKRRAKKASTKASSAKAATSRGKRAVTRKRAAEATVIAIGEDKLQIAREADFALAESEITVSSILEGFRKLKTFIVPVVRPQDLLNLTFQFINLELRFKDKPPAYLVRTDPNSLAYIVVHFPPQHIGEEAFFETPPTGFKPRPDDLDKSSPPKMPSGPARSRIAGPSRLVFAVPNQIKEIPYTLEALLDWSKYDISVSPLAGPPPSPFIIFTAWEGGILTTVSTFMLQPPTIKIDLSGPKAHLQFALSDRSRSVGTGLLKPGDFNFKFLAIEEPRIFQTAIEAPYRLIISPSYLAGWAHSTAPVTQKSGRTELWHTRLGVKNDDGTIDEANDYYRTLRAIWSPDYRGDVLQNHFPGSLHDPFSEDVFRLSLDSRDRNEMVWLTSDFAIDGYEARVIQANRLMLSALGAWMNTHYAAPPPKKLPVKLKKNDNKALTVEEWRHIAPMGRDQYVRVVYKGYLLPFGHRASLVKVTERKLPTQEEKFDNNAYLFQRMYIIVRQFEKTYPAFGQKDDARRMPFKRVRITTLVTPNLDDPANSEVVSGKNQSAFWPRVGNQDFLFHLIGEDEDGQRSEFTAPLIFVDEGVAYDATYAAEYSKAKNLSRRQSNLFGQKVAFAKSSNASPGDTTFDTTQIIFEAEDTRAGVSLTSLTNQDQPRCYPFVKQAKVELAALKQVAGPGQPGTADIEYHGAYKDIGFEGSNQHGEVFAKLVSTVGLQFQADKSGGMATPNLSIQGLSRRFGPLGGSNNAGSLNDLGSGNFNPQDFFSGMSAKILGGLDLWKIIEASFGGGKNVPKLTTTPVYPGNDKAKPPEAIDTLLEWKPTPQTAVPFRAKPTTKLEITAKLHTELNAAATTNYKVNGRLDDFDMDMFGFVILHFNKFTFIAESGKKLDVNPDIASVDFGGPLAFVQELKKYLSGNGGSGFSLDVSPTGVTAGFTLALPTVGVGVLTIQNITFSAGINLPFTGAAVRLRFAFCTREHPFILTVYGLGGGGFFGIALGVDGVELLEAALEFGASVAIDLGVASGSVHIMAGIYYKWENQVTLLTGYFRMGGEVSVLAIVSISIEFYLGLSYESGPGGGKVWGEATLTVQVKVLFFSKSVSMSVRREFADPGRIYFADQMDHSEWDTYCEAFA
jgi:hypothetical protein